MTKGMVLAWTGDNVPIGWALCDGQQNGTPDLRARFILGRDPRGGKNAKVDGDDYNIMKGVGGNQIHQLSVGEMPEHSHKVNDWAPSDTGGQIHHNVLHRNYFYYREQDQSGRPENHNGLFDSDSHSTGASEVHNNMPPYFVLAYIMKL